MATLEDFDRWIDDLDFYQEAPSTVVHKMDCPGERKIKIYTFFICYTIRAVESEDGGYLGCQSIVRAQQPGEDWNRGSDLPDGSLTEETWRQILQAIVRDHLLPVSLRAFDKKPDLKVVE